jgi:biopolymer transport protein ExbD
MKRRTAGLAREHPVAHVNVTPMIDVVMCLIVFYLIVGRLVLERRGEVSLPVSTVGDAVPERADPAVISVEKGGALRLDGRPITLDDLADTLALRPNRRVRLRADRTLPFDAIRPILDACRAAGVRTIDLATERQP